MILGNACETPLREIWTHSEGVRALRAVTRASFPQCRGCGAEKYCAMCLVRNFNESGGDLLKINAHYCDVAWLTKELADEKTRQERDNA
jgi:MoaA/NifB/PqqE/SkfB family radical SAM enzyme